MLKLPKQLRDQITGYLSGLTVPALVGKDIMSIVAALSNLEAVDEPVTKPKK